MAKIFNPQGPDVSKVLETSSTRGKSYNQNRFAIRELSDLLYVLAHTTACDPRSKLLGPNLTSLTNPFINIRMQDFDRLVISREDKTINWGRNSVVNDKGESLDNDSLNSPGQALENDTFVQKR